MLHLLKAFEWKSLLLGSEEWSFLLETVLRTLIMFSIILLGLRLLGKRGVKQLTVFELGVIIGLGSAAGDPMFYKDVGLLHGLFVFAVVLGLYKLITFFINRSTRFEEFVEGLPDCIVNEGQMIVGHVEKEPFAVDEFFSQLRFRSVSHLGQVQQAILEPNGEMSVFFYADDEVKYGLPILPDLAKSKMKAIPSEDYYACTFCGNTVKLSPMPEHTCPCCKKKEWVKAVNFKRIR